MAILVEYTEKLQRAVDTVISPMGIKESNPNSKPRRSTFTDRKGGYGGSNGYKGMFKVEMYQKSDGKYVIRIYNGGDTYPTDDKFDIAEFKRQWAGSCYVNNKRYSVKTFYKEYENWEDYTYWFLKFVYDDKTNSGDVNIVELTSEGAQLSFPDGDNSTSWYLLAEFRHKEANNFIQQHTSSIPQMLWFRNCNEVNADA